MRSNVNAPQESVRLNGSGLRRHSFAAKSSQAINFSGQFPSLFLLRFGSFHAQRVVARLLLLEQFAQFFEFFPTSAK